MDQIKELPYCLKEGQDHLAGKDRAIWVDKEFGEWVARIAHVKAGKALHPKRSQLNRKATNIERRGVANVSQDRKVLVKAQKTKGRSVLIKHWLTGEELACVGSYEVATVKWLNSHKVPFMWQIPHKLEDESVYFVDLYLPEQDVYVEIKGYFRDWEAKAKWIEFKAAHPTAQLWSRKELVAKGILAK